MGANKKPSEVRELEGDLGKRGILVEAEIEPGSMEPPEFLDKIGRKYWRKYAPLMAQLGKFTRYNELVLENLCIAVSARNKMYYEIVNINKSMLQVKNNYGEAELAESDPAKMLRHWTQIVQKIANDCEMTPGRMAGTYKPKKTDAMDEMMD
jgi:phage terminase small subunit